jgi:glycosyltransferase involved in cell wall biosynthesis
MRILLITSRYLPHRGGLESVVSHLAQEYTRQGHVVQIVTNRYPRSLPGREEINGVAVTRLHFLLPDLKYLRNSRFDLWLAGWWYRFRTGQILRRIISDFMPDVINNHYLNEVAEVSGRCVAKFSIQVPWVISLHGADVDGEPYLSLINKKRFLYLSKQADGLTACSAFLAGQAQTLESGLAERITVIHNGVDTQSFACASPRQSEYPYILAVGQLMHHKGFDLLIRAFAKVTKKYPQVQLWIAGDGPQHLALEEIIRQQVLAERVKLLGKVDESQVASLMAGCLFVAMPSRREPFGIVALEGMAAGKPVLAAPVGGLPEFLPEPPNRLVGLNVESWADALDQWLSLAVEGRLKANGNMQAAQEHDWSKVAGQYLRVYEQVLGVE